MFGLLSPNLKDGLHMWLFTNFSFFSVVQKGEVDKLTIRSRQG